VGGSVATRQIPWPRIFAEGVAIVVSILLAFGIQAWWEGRQERTVEQEWLMRLAVEFEAVESALVTWQGYHRGVRRAAEALLDHTGPTPSASLEADSIGALIWAMSYGWTLDPPTATLSSLESSGLELLSSRELQLQLASWRSDLEDLQFQEQVMVRYVYEILQTYINSHAAYRSISFYSRDSIFARDLGRFDNGLASLLSDREFESHVELRRTDSAGVIAEYDALRSRVARIRALIAEELA
jgi:hypothetical protein